MLLDGHNPYSAGLPDVLALGAEDFHFEVSEHNRAALGKRAKWTVIAYLAADCNLARWMFDNLMQLKSAGSSGDVHVLAMFDGPLLTDAFIARLVAGTPLAQDLVMRFTEVNSSDPKFLTQALMLAQAYPADRRLVVFGGHGAGWKGAMIDEEIGRHRYLQQGRVRLSAPAAQCDTELRRCQVDAQDLLNAAIEAQHVEGAGPIDVLAFDACYMSNLESIATYGSHARWLLVSEDQSPGEGLDYATLLTMLKEHPDVDEKDLLRGLVRRQEEMYRRHPLRDAPVTLAALDTSRIPPLAEALVKFAQTLDARDHRLLSTFDEALRAAWRDEVTGVADLKGLAQQLLLRPLPVACAEAARTLVARHDEAVFAFCGGATPSSTNGLSIYAPLPDTFDVDYIRLANDLPHSLGIWAWALGAYYLALVGDRDPHHPLLAALRDTMEAMIRSGEYTGDSKPAL